MAEKQGGLSKLERKWGGPATSWLALRKSTAGRWAIYFQDNPPASVGPCPTGGTEAIRDRSWSDMEWQLRRWLFTTWGSGDFIVEQHVHNLDLVDWVMGSHPIKAIGTGGRSSRTDSIYPNVWDHISVEYEYPNGARVTHIGSQMDGVSSRNDMRIDGTKGRLFLSFAKVSIEGKKPFTYEGPRPNPAVVEYKDTLDAIRSGKPINEGKRIAQSTMTALLGRMAAYTGRTLSWDWAMKASKLDLTPKEWKFGNLALDPIAVPGETDWFEHYDLKISTGSTCFRHRLETRANFVILD